MQTIYAAGPLQALYRVFVLPTLTPTTKVPPSARCKHLVAQPTKSASRREFASTRLRSAKTRAPEERAQKWNEEIPALRIYLLAEGQTRLTDDNHQLPEPVTRFDVLKRINRDTHRLVMLAEASPTPGVPVCRVMSKQEMYEAEKRRKQVKKEEKRNAAAGASAKTLELNWAIDANDLSHRTSRLKEFLGEGRRVEILLASKKRGRKASIPECTDVLEKIRGAVGQVAGAREVAEMEGRIGGVCTLLFEGRRMKRASEEGE